MHEFTRTVKQAVLLSVTGKLVKCCSTPSRTAHLKYSVLRVACYCFTWRPKCPFRHKSSAKLLIFIGVKKKNILGQSLSFRSICYDLSCHPTGTIGISFVPGWLASYPMQGGYQSDATPYCSRRLSAVDVFQSVTSELFPLSCCGYWWRQGNVRGNS